MIGIDARTGQRLDGDAHLAQSIGDILSTPLGTRIMRRDYGSLLPELIDRPLNDRTRIEIYAATAVALRRHEPRLRLTLIGIDAGPQGTATIALEGYRTDTPGPNSFTRLTLPLRAARPN
ncbi:GPW/gp25 family protein [Novosphingopyxis sp. YJ-S2-01]|uniref:GPW/gp25 family protein n=1 Tax=Novosphingopyxis sp. YJ-S2-01 TaxID=2794021 RepID=UPI0018DBFD6D|nr:GPW/gp25 family protein [Novosphingopyxis sp. YJ-S2-01]MBH9536923.1 GPW/gp25 family protein [Novosphingopyxis sp. YJ-S2-01]